ncbi:unnamed protein product [Aphis gossypii]|uniref:Uncharacterized protein n=1 Tax=Aphis gossypii TaxID=80765 RepID=A0A9P0IPG0_APHGO|nr:unnamed protein product [Aphis gossypii]
MKWFKVISTVYALVFVSFSYFTQCSGAPPTAPSRSLAQNSTKAISLKCTSLARCVPSKPKVFPATAAVAAALADLLKTAVVPSNEHQHRPNYTLHQFPEVSANFRPVHRNRSFTAINTIAHIDNTNPINLNSTTYHRNTVNTIRNRRFGYNSDSVTDNPVRLANRLSTDDSSDIKKIDVSVRPGIGHPFFCTDRTAIVGRHVTKIVPKGWYTL